MPPVFAHGRLRLYLLKLLDEAPRHGYEVIRLLEERFQGLYAPSAGTVYPRLAKLEAEGLVTHTSEGGRKVYSITDAGRAELADRSGELADLELEIRESVAELAAEIRDDVRGAAGDLRREMRAAAGETRRGASSRKADKADWPGMDNPLGDTDTWLQAKEDLRRAKQEWKEQARRAKDESRRARDEAQRARRQAKEAQDAARDEVQRIAKRVQDQVQDHFTRGDWPTGLREGLAEITKEFGRFGKSASGPGTSGSGTSESGPSAAGTATAPPPAPEPEWVRQDSTGDPARDLDRLLDRFRDDIRDAARDHGVTEAQLRDARRHLSAAAAHIGAALRGGTGSSGGTPQA
ncbi:PadR family transcriptional regulator [Streptomyces boluensis]|uniref:PadR family transcriptional regulator n=1 Tax=Streptomyces boluensis TaxID=1775135 RepID=A0A964UTL7_9ACTN|nr:PadR family transcriptional regulator [Streptomyces boluensis]NBE55199.1 PadR family transcriptional regulator [Streptomyces boluensis]